ncbi:PREDICTED: 5'-nucleotidase [Prunus dulcis]|uniref:PREDICTED: 5'-nucleotidase n=1 Tax=Prunus dulcis TaxID=3755 RepID=A0A5E4FTT0_PRUDU|nr:PREDICTED: 5'-nucleotidase [Prunus dulcis]
MPIPTVTVTLSSLSPSASLFFIDLFSVLYLYHYLFLNPKRESHRRPSPRRQEPSESLCLPLSSSSSIDRSVADVSVTVRETIYVSSSQINSATSFEVSGLDDSRFYSDAVAGAREALIWKKDLSYESDMKNAVGVSLPLIYAVVKSIQEEVFPKSCLLNIEIPSSPWTNKVLSSIALWLFTAAKAPKDKHPYGHS